MKLNLKFQTLLAILICLFLSINAKADSKDTLNLSSLVNRAFKSGEALKYKVYYTASIVYIPAGEVGFNAELEKYNEKTCWHFKGTGSSYHSYDWFFKVRDLYESYVDTLLMLPIKFLRNVQEGSYRLYHNVTFKQDKHIAISTKGVYKVPPGIQDIMSAVFSIRNVDYSKFKIGQKVPFNIFIDDEIWPIYIRYLGKEKITLKYGTFNCIKFSPYLIKGSLFKGGEGMTIWVTDDANRIPIRIESEVSVGKVRADIIQMQNLRNPLTSKLN